MRRIVEDGLDPVLVLDQRPDAGAGAHLAAVLDDVGGVGGGDRAEVDHAGGRRMQRGEAARRGLDRAHLVGPDAREAGNAVGARPALEVVEALQVGGPGRDHELPAALRGDPRSSQYAYSAAAPSTHGRAFSEPGS